MSFRMGRASALLADGKQGQRFAVCCDATAVTIQILNVHGFLGILYCNEGKSFVRLCHKRACDYPGVWVTCGFYTQFPCNGKTPLSTLACILHIVMTYSPFIGDKNELQAPTRVKVSIYSSSSRIAACCRSSQAHAWPPQRQTCTTRRP